MQENSDHKQNMVLYSQNTKKTEQYQTSQTYLSAMRRIQNHNQQLILQNRNYRIQLQALKQQHLTIKLRALQWQKQKLQYQTKIHTILTNHTIANQKNIKAQNQIFKLQKQILSLKSHLSYTPTKSYQNSAVNTDQIIQAVSQTSKQKQFTEKPLESFSKNPPPSFSNSVLKAEVTNTKSKNNEQLNILLNPQNSQRYKDQNKNILQASNINHSIKKKFSSTSITPLKNQVEYRNMLKQTIKNEKYLVQLIHQREIYQRQLMTGRKKNSTIGMIQQINKQIQVVRSKIKQNGSKLSIKRI